jgi:hypothetical protein
MLRSPLWSRIAFALSLAAGLPLHAADIVINPGESIQAKVNAYPDGTRFLLKAGVHRQQEVSPKNGNVFSGEPGAVLNGAKLLSQFGRDGVLWTATGQTQPPGVPSGTIEPGWEGSRYDQDLFVDDKLLKHVLSKAAVVPGTWYFDDAADRIYIADDPTGHKVETSVARRAFSSMATNVVIQGLVVEKYAIPAQWGAIGDQRSGAGWTVQDCEVRLNHGTGIQMATGWKARRNKCHHNGLKGMGGVGDDMIVDGNEIACNNTLHFDRGWEGAGTKWTFTKRLAVTNNYVHDNYGTGLWTDAQNLDTVYDGNTVINNNYNGILHEISYHAIIRNNVCSGNGFYQAWAFGAQILVQNSRDVEIYGNRIEVAVDHGNGIELLQGNRDADDLGPWPTKNNYVHHNTIIHRSTRGGDGAQADYKSAEMFDPTIGNNRFNYNSYYVTDLNALHWRWANLDMTFGKFRWYGHEANGTMQLGTPDSTVPTVSITAPAANAAVSGTVTISASASDTVGVSKVAFLVDGVALATDTIAPYSASWNTAALLAGSSHTITVIAYDAAGNNASATRTVTIATIDITAPSVVISAPTTSASVSGLVTVMAAASDNVAVSKVVFLVDGTLLATDTASPYSASWNTASLAAGSSHAITATAYDAAGNSAANSRTVTIASAGSGSGLSVSYFPTPTLQGTAVTRTDATVDFDWSTGSPAAGVLADSFSARWIGQVQAPTSEIYTFNVLADDGVRLWVGGQLVIDRWVMQAPTACTGSIAMTAGVKIDIKLEYFENTGGATCRLRWSTPTRALTVVPSTQLFPAVVQEPYRGAARAIPGIVQAEDFDDGGEAVAYHDSDAANNGGCYRTSAVDIRVCNDTGAGMQVGWFGAGEWLEYTVSTPAGITCDIGVRLACGTSGGTVRVFVDGVDRTGAIAFLGTGGWDTFTTVTRSGIAVSAGLHVVRLACESGALDCNWISFTQTPRVVSGQWYKLVAKHSGKCLTVDGGSTFDGAITEQQTDSGSTAQQWRIDALADGSYTLTARCSGKVLDVSGASLLDGAYVTQYVSHGGLNQRWRIESTGNGLYRIISVNSGKVVEIPGTSAIDGADAAQRTDAGTDNQRWTLVLLPPTSGG